MCMPDNAVTAAEILKAAFRQHFRGEVLPQRAIGTAVYQSEVADFQALRQIDEERAVLLRQLLRRPFRRDAGGGAKVLQIDLADGGPVVVACDDDLGTCA